MLLLCWWRTCCSNARMRSLQSHLFCRISIETMFFRWYSPLSVKGDRRWRERRLCLVSKRWFSFGCFCFLIFTFETMWKQSFVCEFSLLRIVTSCFSVVVEVTFSGCVDMVFWIVAGGRVIRHCLSQRVFLPMVTIRQPFFFFCKLWFVTERTRFSICLSEVYCRQGTADFRHAVDPRWGIFGISGAFGLVFKFKQAQRQQRRRQRSELAMPRLTHGDR